jgi:hypothetical protein
MTFAHKVHLSHLSILKILKNTCLSFLPCLLLLRLLSPPLFPSLLCFVRDIPLDLFELFFLAILGQCRLSRSLRGLLENKLDDGWIGSVFPKNAARRYSAHGDGGAVAPLFRRKSGELLGTMVEKPRGGEQADHRVGGEALLGEWKRKREV